MKKTILALGVLTLLTTQAYSAEVIKTCTSTIQSLDSSAKTKFHINIIQSGDDLSASVRQINDGVHTTLKEDVSLKTYKIRRDINTGDTEGGEEYNQGEAILSHAMNLESDEIFEGQFTTGIKNLNKVRKVKVYQIGDSTNMGSFSVVEAFDKKGNDLGSFIGGFLIGSCK